MLESVQRPLYRGNELKEPRGRTSLSARYIPDKVSRSVHCHCRCRAESHRCKLFTTLLFSSECARARIYTHTQRQRFDRTWTRLTAGQRTRPPGVGHTGSAGMDRPSVENSRRRDAHLIVNNSITPRYTVTLLHPSLFFLVDSK